MKDTKLLYGLQVGDQIFDPTQPWEHEFRLADAVKAISNISRYGGHTPFYSVAQHSVLVSLLSPNRSWDGLAHDLAEAYYWDILTPYKLLMAELAPKFLAVLQGIDNAVENAFLSTGTSYEEVKRADRIALATERRDLLTLGDTDVQAAWKAVQLPRPALGCQIVPLSPEMAERAWWRRYWQLRAQNKAPALKHITHVEDIDDLTPPVSTKGNTP